MEKLIKIELSLPIYILVYLTLKGSPASILDTIFCVSSLGIR